MIDINLLNTLLDRSFFVADQKKMLAFIQDKTILITGGGGTIGSELCRQLYSLNPKKIVIFDNHENSTYEIQQELIVKYKIKSELAIVIASITGKNRADDIFCEHNPEIVFHTAAYKHLPLMEENPLAAVQNNIFGTINIVDAAKKYNAEKMIFTSSDKAVNPECIMGLTKRIAEKYITYIATNSKLCCSSVRFGNVLGSNGCVFSLFEKQIKNGGPITVTHPDITRYFMTIKEAVSLLLISLEKTKGGEVFILNMGKPIKIIDIACRFASLYGFTVEKDILIDFIGLRKNEKLHEELFGNEEAGELLEDGIFLVKEKNKDMVNYFNLLDVVKNIEYASNNIYTLLKGMVL